MDIEVKEEVLDIPEDVLDFSIDYDIVKEETQIQEVNVQVQEIETKIKDIESNPGVERPDGEDAEQGLKRKLKGNPENWIQNRRKKLRQSGQEYTSRKGVLVAARRVKSPCGSKCRRACKEFSKEDREKVFQSYWKLSDKDKKAFISKFVRKIPTVRKIKGRSRRKYTHQYFLQKDDTKYQICKTFFLNTLDISSKGVDYIKKNAESPEGMRKTVTRGRNRPSNYSDVDQLKVEEHINSFPRVESHYCCASSKREYLDPNLSVSQMHRLFQEQNPEVEITEPAYRKIFKSFNLSFHKPKDHCSTCAKIKKGKLCEESADKHNRRNEMMKIERQKDMSLLVDPETVVISYDLQNTISLPKSSIGTFYFKRKLSVFNLTAHCSINGVTYCCIWTEAESDRTGDDLASALNKILKSIIQDVAWIKNMKNIILWSDSCVPQNRNTYTATTLLQFLHDNPNIKSITQKFSETGHSLIQNVDSIHKTLDKALRHYTIGSPIALMRILKSLKFPKTTLKILDMQDVDFKQFSHKAKLLLWDHVPFTKISMIRYCTESLTSVKVKLDPTEDWIEHSVLKRKLKSSTPPNFFTMELKQMEPCEPVALDKKKDILSILHFLPEDDQLYYSIKLNLHDLDVKIDVKSKKVKKIK